MTLRRIKRIRSYAGHARYLAECDEGIAGEIPRQPQIPSPYAYSPTHQVLRHSSGRLVIIVETTHRCYDVFAVDAEEVQV